MFQHKFSNCTYSELSRRFNPAERETTYRIEFQKRFHRSLDNSFRELELLKNGVNQIKTQDVSGSEAGMKENLGQQRSKLETSRIQCFKCKEFGHYQKDCLKQFKPGQNVGHFGKHSCKLN